MKPLQRILELVIDQPKGLRMQKISIEDGRGSDILSYSLEHLRMLKVEVRKKLSH